MILSTGSAYLFCPIELEISGPIWRYLQNELYISPIQLEISTIELQISAIQGINVKTARHRKLHMAPGHEVAVRSLGVLETIL